MKTQELQQKLTDLLHKNPENAIQAAYALDPEFVGIRYYDAPLLGCADADDPIFVQMQTDPKIVGPMMRLPAEWLPGAKRVLSFFLPYSRAIRTSNLPNPGVPSRQWLHARIEGQAYLMHVCHQLAGWLQDAGYQTVIPAEQPEFCTQKDPERLKRGEPVYASSWSERHAAYAAGLGTFSLSKHIITKKGVCGRFGSIITDAPLDITPRPYTDPFEYCIFCGRCGLRCPIGAISALHGKDILACAAFLDSTAAAYAPRYGCGKCQQEVPCETGIPKKVQ